MCKHIVMCECHNITDHNHAEQILNDRHVCMRLKLFEAKIV